ncbi:helix-turn-helix domain-containing protein [Streptomyces sp. NPDC056149]|uniref:helix-turn-helix domain-containing protein n=1 Tax=Streptomyces sp. NPDC056149 TaxID=3345728 RepID=UPI0035D81503
MSLAVPSTPQPQAGAPEAVVMTTKHAAAYLGVAIPTLRSWRHRRCGPNSFRMEGKVVYRRAALDAFLDACEAADSRSNPELDPLNQARAAARRAVAGLPR